MERPLAYGYVSLTGDDEDEVSELHRQVTAFADVESYVLAEVYVDRNMPPGRLIRPGLSVLLDRLRLREGCCVIVPTSDHLSTWAAIRKAIEMEIQLLGGKLVVANAGRTGSGHEASAMSDTVNIAFAGLTAAGKTTHAKRLADDLGYDYVSATEILLEMLEIDDPSESIWNSRLDEINAVRLDGSVDAELEDRLVALNRERERTVFDTWALAWIGDDPLVRIWIESDVDSRVRKCLVSQGDVRMSPEECSTLLKRKDEFNRWSFRLRHNFDLFMDRQRYDIVLANSHLIPVPTASAARSGIDTFAPVVKAAVSCALRSDESAAQNLHQEYPREIQRITVQHNSRSR